MAHGLECVHFSFIPDLWEIICSDRFFFFFLLCRLCVFVYVFVGFYREVSPSSPREVFFVPFGEVERRCCPSIDYVLETHMLGKTGAVLGGIDWMMRFC